METPDNIQVFQMASGTLVISEVVETGQDEIVLRYPLEMNFSFEDDGSTRLYLNRWMPYNEKDLVTINTRTVECKTVCSEKYRNMYDVRITHFKKALEAALQYVNDEDEDSGEDGLDDSDTNDQETPSQTPSYKPTFH